MPLLGSYVMNLDSMGVHGLHVFQLRMVLVFCISSIYSATSCCKMDVIVDLWDQGITEFALFAKIAVFFDSVCSVAATLVKHCFYLIPTDLIILTFFECIIISVLTMFALFTEF